MTSISASSTPGPGSVSPPGAGSAPAPGPPPTGRLRVSAALVFGASWPEPDRPQRWPLAAAAGVGLLSALLLPAGSRVGVNVVICGLAAAIPVARLGYRRGRALERRPPLGRVAVALGLVAVGLAAVAGVRASEWLAWGCALAALCLGAAVALDVRRWRGVLVTVPLFVVAVGRSLPWAGRAARMENVRSRSMPWLTGLAIGSAFMLVVTGLLASADSAFADAISALQTSVDLGLLPSRVLVFALAAAIVLGGCFAVSTRLVWPGSGPGAARERHPAEWLLPLVLVGVAIGAFLAVEATTLFGGVEVVRHSGTVTHASRARQGFGQLSVVTLIVLGLLSWAGPIASAGPARHRRLMAVIGGGLLGLTLLLTASALRRLGLYQEAYGWTVTRVNAGAFELWVALVLVGVAVGWAARRPDLLPRFVIGSAGLGLLVVAMIGPDALVASGSVHRFEQTGKIDTVYLSTLSADAVPALNRLPEPFRSCALSRSDLADDPWFDWNFSRARANHILARRPLPQCPASNRP